jgi:hypothetical protein
MAGGSVDISGVSYDGKQATLQKVEKDVTLTDDPLMIQQKARVKHLFRYMYKWIRSLDGLQIAWTMVFQCQCQTNVVVSFV